MNKHKVFEIWHKHFDDVLHKQLQERLKMDKEAGEPRVLYQIIYADQIKGGNDGKDIQNQMG